MAVVKSNATRAAACAALCILVMASSALSELVEVKKDCFHMDPCTFRKCADDCLHRAKTEDKPVKNSCDTTTECCCRYYEWHPSPPPSHRAGVAAAAEGGDGGFLG